MMTFLDKLTPQELKELGEKFRGNKPYNHIVIDNFLDDNDAYKIAEEFPEFEDSCWYSYENPLEIKKATNNWNHFGPNTYNYFSHILSDAFTNKLSVLLSENNRIQLSPDKGLHGGGLHSHKNGGRLNPHLDYSIHPKLFLQRKINIILYINPNWKAQYGGTLGLWSDMDGQPNKLVHKVDTLFNRALIFDTTQNSWHGICEEINSENNLTRNSLATYYLTNPMNNADPRMKVKYAPREDQKGDPTIEELIEKRQSMLEFQKVYRIDNK
jgi:Rps23 Pro-64 3,4-dihydroxylase Tpa1-like proline 4-hydroxylase